MVCERPSIASRFAPASPTFSQQASLPCPAQRAKVPFHRARAEVSHMVRLSRRAGAMALGPECAWNAEAGLPARAVSGVVSTADAKGTRKGRGNPSEPKPPERCPDSNRWKPNEPKANSNSNEPQLRRNPIEPKLVCDEVLGEDWKDLRGLVKARLTEAHRGRKLRSR
jgi:hypothetical protein